MLLEHGVARGALYAETLERERRLCVVFALSEGDAGANRETAAAPEAVGRERRDVRIVGRQRDVLAVHLHLSPFGVQRAGDVDFPFLRRRRGQREAIEHRALGADPARLDIERLDLAGEERLHRLVDEPDPTAREDEGGDRHVRRGCRGGRRRGRRRGALVRGPADRRDDEPVGRARRLDGRLLETHVAERDVDGRGCDGRRSREDTGQLEGVDRHAEVSPRDCEDAGVGSLELNAVERDVSLDGDGTGPGRIAAVGREAGLDGQVRTERRGLEKPRRHTNGRVRRVDELLAPGLARTRLRALRPLVRPVLQLVP